MKKLYIFMMIAVMTVFISCSKKPQDMASADSNESAGADAVPSSLQADSDKNNDEDEEEPQKYVSLSEARKQIDDIRGDDDRKGFGIPYYMSMPDETTEEIYSIELKAFYSNELEPCYSVLKGICPYIESVTPENADTVNDRVFEDVTIAGNGIWNYDVAAGDVGYGWTSFGCPGAENIKIGTQYERVLKQYDIIWGDEVKEDDVYELGGEQVSLSEAIKFAEERVNRYFPKLEDEAFEYKVQHAAISITKETKEQHFVFVMGRVYKGMPVDTCSIFCGNQVSSYNRNISGKYIFVKMKTKDEIGAFFTGDSLLNIKDVQSYEQIISPEYALYIMNKEIAHAGGMGFSEGGLIYLISQNVYSTYNGAEKRYENTKTVAWTDETKCKTEIRPYWAFYQDYTGGGFVTNNGIKDIHGISILVDAIDGSVYYYPMTGAY